MELNHTTSKLLEDLQQLVLEKIRMLMLVTVQKFTELENNDQYRLYFLNKCFNTVNESVEKLVNFQFNHKKSNDNDSSLGNDLKRMKKKAKKLKIRNKVLKSANSNQAKEFLKFSKYFSTKYQSHIEEIKEKNAKIEQLTRKNEVLEKNLSQILKSSRNGYLISNSNKEDLTCEMLHKCIQNQGFILEGMYLKEKNMAMIDTLLAAARENQHTGEFMET